MRMRSPSAMPSPANAAGWISAIGRPSRATPEGVLLKLVLRNERDGAGTMRNGRSGSPSSMIGDVVGEFG